MTPRCRLPHDAARVIAARRWLADHCVLDHNPGQFIPANADLRDATYYYYLFSLSRTLAELQRRHLPVPRDDWPTAIARELVRRQHSDGSWSNSFTDGKEDDTLVATPLALQMLVVCQHAMSE